MKNSAITAFLGWGVCCPGRFVGFLCLAQVVENLAGPCPGWALLRLRSLPPVEGTSVTSAPSFESFSKECCAFFFPAGFESVEKFPCNLLEFVLCSRGCLGMKTVLFFFFLNDLIDLQKNHIKTAPGAWPGCPRFLYLWSGIAGLRWCLANSPWLSVGTRMEREGEVGGGLECFEKAELCFYP